MLLDELQAFERQSVITREGFRDHQPGHQAGGSDRLVEGETITRVCIQGGGGTYLGDHTFAYQVLQD